MIFGAGTPRRPRTARASRRAAAEDAIHVEDLPPKLIPSLRALFSTGTALLHTRLALAGVELEEEMQRLIGAIALALIAVVAVLLALIVGTFTIVVAVPPEYRVLTMIAITVLYLVLAVVLLMRIKSVFKMRPPIFAATLAELEKDKETWSHMARAHDAAEEAQARATRDERFADVRAASVRSN
jgi:uncharacterized membrane protein YqjE